MADDLSDEYLVFGFSRDCAKKYVLLQSIADDVVWLIFSYFEVHVIVIDNGTATLKVGRAGFDEPDDVFPSVIGRYKYRGAVPVDYKEPRSHLKIGYEAEPLKGILRLSQPIIDGTIQSWDDMVCPSTIAFENILNHSLIHFALHTEQKILWDYAFNESLEIDPVGSYVIATVNPASSLEGTVSKEKMTKIMFEKYKVYGFYLELSQKLALYATGRETGLVVDSGDSCTHIVPIFEGYELPQALTRLDVGGRDVTDRLRKLCRDRHPQHGVATTADPVIARDIKERCCYIADDYALENEKDAAEIGQEYEMPDGNVLKIGRERYEAPECIFQPSLIGREQAGVTDLVRQSVMRCGMEARREMLGNIVLTGGNTMFDGFEKRLRKEMSAIFDTNVDIIATPDRYHGVWIGGSLLASTSDFESMWTTSDEYNK